MIAFVDIISFDIFKVLFVACCAHVACFRRVMRPGAGMVRLALKVIAAFKIWQVG